MARSTGLHGPLITFNLPRKSEKFAPRLVKDVLLKKKFDQKETPNFLPKFLNENKVYYCTYCLMNAMVPLNSPSQSFTRFINPHVFYPTTGLYVYFYILGFFFISMSLCYCLGQPGILKTVAMKQKTRFSQVMQTSLWGYWVSLKLLMSL